MTVYKYKSSVLLTLLSLYCYCVSEPTVIIPKLPISIYYESLCPDSVRFVNNQLYPTYKELGKLLDIKFIPFGKSSSIGNGESFICQHGPKECTGNKLQSCGLSLIPENERQVEFVNCFMTPGRFTALDCAKIIGIDWEAVKQCYYSEGVHLQLQAEKETKQILPKFVPTIVYNGVFDQRDQDRSQTDFRGVVCDYLEKIVPDICNQN